MLNMNIVQTTGLFGHYSYIFFINKKEKKRSENQVNKFCLSSIHDANLIAFSYL